MHGKGGDAKAAPPGGAEAGWAGQYLGASGAPAATRGGKPPQDHAVPLVTWGYALATSLLILWLVGTIALNLKPPPSEPFYAYNAARLEALAEKTGRGDIGVVLLGDSRLRYGIPDDDSFAAALSTKLGRSVSVVRLVNNWAVMADFELLIDLIFAAEPKLVVFQEGLFAKERAAQAVLLIRRAYLIWRLFGSGPWNPGDLDQQELQTEQRCDVLMDIDVDERREMMAKWFHFDPAGENARLAAAFRAETLARGIAFLPLAIPITTAGEAGLPRFQRPADLKPLIVPTQIPDESFCDAVHMNPAGRAVFSSRLSTALADHLKDLKP